MREKYQEGFISSIQVSLILCVIIIVGVAGFYVERQGMMKTIKEQTVTITQQKEAILALEEINKKLVGENQTLNRQIVLMNKIIEDNDAERSKREKQYRELETKYKRLGESLPSALPDEKVCKMTEMEAKNSEQRIHYLWNIFQMDGNLILPVNSGNVNPVSK